MINQNVLIVIDCLFNFLQDNWFGQNLDLILSFPEAATALAWT
jgi:hypothetical protein